MASSYPECFDRLSSNPEGDFLKAANLLLKIIQNIEDNPGVEKYRSIKVGSKTFMETLLPIDGAIQCLLEVGFEEQDDRFIYKSDNHDGLKAMRWHLDKAIRDKQKPAKQVKNFLNFDDVNIRSTEIRTFQSLDSTFRHSLVYENAILQAKARSKIPIETLRREAQKRLSETPKFVTHNGSIPLQMEDCMILALLSWFKKDFFRWVDSPPCPKCKDSKCTSSGPLQPTKEELRWGAGKVEGHRCNRCFDIIRFPRYNDPEKLLETRSGRCGEWADCFTLLCRSLGYDTRHIYDFTDHVWTEVFSKAAQRWIHCDPCENAFDKPLLYEKGWGKKLSLIVATSCDEIVDVTWRYTEGSDELLARRRKLCRENRLDSTLKKMNITRQKKFPQERKSRIIDRKIREIAEFLSPKLESSIVYEGRKTGSLAWRMARGETGLEIQKEDDNSICPKDFIGEDDKEVTLKYFSKLDSYQSNVDEYCISNWDSLAYSTSHIMRKEEFDWRTVYLARTESKDRGHISWKFDLKDLTEKVIIKEISVRVESTTFQSGKVKWLLCADNKTVPLNEGRFPNIPSEVYGSRSVSIHAFLSGGEGDVAWQHTQLFRTSMDSKDDEPQFDITLKYGLKE